MLQDWGALENQKIRRLGLFCSNRALCVDWEIKEQNMMGVWGCCVYMSELSDPTGRPRLHSCCG